MATTQTTETTGAVDYATSDLPTVTARKTVGIADAFCHLTRWSDGSVWLQVLTDANQCAIKLPASAVGHVADFLARDTITAEGK